jgi:cytochrome bd-type quinol oxidase subunit 2
VEARSVPGEVGYEGTAVAGAVLATLFFPLIALIAALILQGGQSDPRKRSQLRTWAWASGGWLVFGVLIAVVLVSVASGNGSGGF